MFCSLVRRRTCWIAETVKVDAVCNVSGGIKESVHEGLESMLLGVHNLEGRQLIFSGVFAVHSDQRQGNVSATASGQFLPFLHSARDLIQSSHQ